MSRYMVATDLAIENGLRMSEVSEMTGKPNSTLVRWCKNNRPLYEVILKGCQAVKSETKEAGK